jgi:hypothetical protein
MRGFPLPGVADHVLAGRLPGTELDGRFVMFGAAPEMRSEGREIALTSDHPLAASGLLVRMPAEPGADAVAAAELPDDYELEARGREVMVWRPIQGNLLRTAAGSDNFCRRAGEVLQRLSRPG